MTQLNRVFAAVDYVYKCASTRMDLHSPFKALADEITRVRNPHTIEVTASEDECNRIMYAVLQTVFDGDIDCMAKMACYLDNYNNEHVFRRSNIESHYEEYVFS